MIRFVFLRDCWLYREKFIGDDSESRYQKNLRELIKKIIRINWKSQYIRKVKFIFFTCIVRIQRRLEVFFGLYSLDVGRLEIEIFEFRFSFYLDLILRIMAVFKV